MWSAIQFSLMATSIATLLLWLEIRLIRKRKATAFEICFFFAGMFVLAATIYYFLLRL